MQLPALNRSKPSSSSVPRIHHWAARLALLVACIGSVATSPSHPPEMDQEEQEHEGTPLTLSTESPKATRHLRLQFSTNEPSSKTVQFNLVANSSTRWKPDEPASSLEPRFRLRMTMEPPPEGSPGWNQPVWFEGNEGTGRQYASVATGGECKLDQVCEWSVPLEFELVPNGTAGTAEVEWTVRVWASTPKGEMPEGFTVQLSEP